MDDEAVQSKIKLLTHTHTCTQTLLMNRPFFDSLSPFTNCTIVSFSPVPSLHTDGGDLCGGIGTYTHVTVIENGNNYRLSRVLSLLLRKLQNLCGNDAVGTSTLIYRHFYAYMASPSGTSSFILVAVNAKLENSSFKTLSELVCHPHESAETLRVCWENETNEALYTKFSCLLLKELEGPLPTNATFALY